MFGEGRWKLVAVVVGFVGLVAGVTWRRVGLFIIIFSFVSRRGFFRLFEIFVSVELELDKGKENSGESLGF